MTSNAAHHSNELLTSCKLKEHRQLWLPSSVTSKRVERAPCADRPVIGENGVSPLIENIESAPLLCALADNAL